MISQKKINLFICLLFLINSSCAHAQFERADLSIKQKRTFHGSYPDTWWKHVPVDQVKSWEIPPQQADREKNEVVLSKRTELGVFSNLADISFVLDDTRYKSLEGLWQGMKYPENAKDERFADSNVIWPYTREEVYMMSGFDAKKAGDIANANMKKLGIKWITYQGKKIYYNSEDGKMEHYNIIYRASFEKVKQNQSLKELLLQTGDLNFLSDHIQHDNPNPAYLYFDIYMRIRNEIRK
ncbi:MAG: hypothetical protein ACK41T_06460 [Pseudobdellovibrio sp.]